MRDFSWNYFSMTGDVNAYLLYKEMLMPAESAVPAEEPQEQEEGEAVV
ncbi:MAG: YqzL-like protein [Paenibacillaceae bacterium]|nr:YqzL-like protein [Paenibacillaceae bacterium]